MTRMAQAPSFAAPATPPGWTPARIAGAVALVVAGVLATWDAWADIYHIARKDEEASHIFLVPLIFGWLVWSRREKASEVAPSNSIVGPLLILLGGLMNDYGFDHMTQAALHGGAVLAVIGCFVTVAGWRLVWALLPAFVLLGFLVPVPGMIRQQIALPMQTYTAGITYWVYDALGLDISRQGNVLYFNEQQIAVAEACNGMRMIFALILVTYGVAFATPLRGWVRVMLLAMSPLFAIGCNVIRLLPTVALYGYYPDDVGPVFHDLSGWLMIGVAFALLMGLLSVLRWAYIPIMQPGHEPELDGEEG